MLPTIADVIKFIVSHRPGLSESELSFAMFGERVQQRVNSDCRLLAGRGLIERRGSGGPSDPYRYFPTAFAVSSSHPGGQPLDGNPGGMVRR